MDAYEEFLHIHPDFTQRFSLDRLRDTEYARLDTQGQVYLDFTGGGLYAASQVHQHARMLGEQVLGNPHSLNPSSMETTGRVEQARQAVLQHFNAQDDYTAIFTPNASGALKLVGEAYPFAPGTALLLTADDHNSVNGMREFALAKGAEVQYAPLTRPDLRLDAAALAALLDGSSGSQPRLMAFPAQSNFSGVQCFLDFARGFKDQTALSIGAVSFDIETCRVVRDGG